MQEEGVLRGLREADYTARVQKEGGRSTSIWLHNLRIRRAIATAANS